MTAFFERLSLLCKEANTSPNAVARQLSISSGSITAWKNGTMPRMETLQALADYFHVSADYLIGNVSEPFFYLDNKRIAADVNGTAENPEARGSGVTDEDIKFALFGGDGEITDSMYEEVKRFAAFVKQREAEKKKEN